MLRPFKFIINREYQIVLVYGSGHAAFQDILANMDQLLADPEFNPHFKELADCRDAAGPQLTTEEVRQLAERTVFARDSRRAIVVASELQFGLARLFGAHREIQGESRFRVFREIPEAAAFVDVPADWAVQELAKLKGAGA